MRLEQSGMAADEAACAARRTVPLEANRDAMFSEARLAAVLAGVLGMTSLILASVGVFGVFAYMVRQQTHEIGVRKALGAQSGQVVAGVVALGSRPLVIGLLVGLAAAMAAAQLLRSSLYGLSPFDPLSYTAVMVILGVAALVAVSVPAWRAARIDPMVTLRHG
jgi:putative ABC transport system permease protein